MVYDDMGIRVRCFLVFQQRDGTVGMPESDAPRFFLHRDARPRLVVAHAKHHGRIVGWCCRGCLLTAKPSDPPRQPLTAVARPQPLQRMAIQPQGGPVPAERHGRLARQAAGGADGHAAGNVGAEVVWEVVFGGDGRACVG
jgi:hypothetical protein